MSYFGVVTTKLLTQIKESNGPVRKELIEKLYSTTANHLKVIAARYLVDRSQIEDVIIEAFARIILYIDKFDSNRDGYNWLCKIVENEARNINKQSRKETVGIPDYYMDRGTDFSIQAYLEVVEERNAVMEAVSKCPPDMQELYYLEYIEGMTRKQISDLKHVAKSTITKRCAKLERLVRKELEKSDF